MIRNIDMRMVFGFGILIMLTVLALVIALGKVEQQTSHGLEIVLGALSVLSGGFAQWAFKDKPESPKLHAPE